MKPGSWRFFAVFLAVVAMVAAACDSDDSSSDGSGEEDSSADEMEIPAGPPVSGEPFKVGVITSEGVGGIDLPDLANGAEAGTEYVNAELGGIGGRPLEAVVCNGEAEPAGNAACAQQFVDEGVLAVAGLDPAWGDNGLPITTEADITFIGLPVVFAEFLGDASHPFGGGSLSAFPAQAKYWGETVGVDKASIVYADLAAGETAAKELLGAPMEELGVDVTYVPEATGAADYTSAVVQANESDPDVMIILYSATDCARVLAAAQQVGVEAQRAASGSCADEAALDIAGEEAINGLVVNSDTHFIAQEGEPEFEEAEIFRDRVVRYADQEPTSFSAATFSQVVTLADIANQIVEEQGVDAVTASTVKTQIESLTDQHIFMGASFDATDPIVLAGVETSVYAKDQRIYEYSNGELTDIGGGWVNGFE